MYFPVRKVTKAEVEVSRDVVWMGRLVRRMFKGAALANPVLQSLTPSEPARAHAVFPPFAQPGRGAGRAYCSPVTRKTSRRATETAWSAKRS